MLCVIRNRIRLSWVLNTARNEPGNYVGDFLSDIGLPARCLASWARPTQDVQ